MSARWSEKDADRLASLWGVRPLDEICRRLGRTKESVRGKARRMALGNSWEENGRSIALNALSEACGMSRHSGLVKRYLETRGLRVRTKRYGARVYYVIRLDEFWKWLETHRSAWPVSRITPLALGAEPDWVAEQRERERDFARRRKGARWTPQEEALLRSLVRQKVPLNEIARQLGRGHDGIYRRTIELKLVPDLERGNHEYFSEEEDARLRDLIRAGAGMSEISERLDRGANGLRNHLRRRFGTRDLDALRRKFLEDESKQHGRADQ